MTSGSDANKTKNTGRNWTQYLSYGIQLMATIGVGLYIGYWADKSLHLSIPLLIWIVPTLLLVFMLVKLVKTFSKKEKEK